MQALSFKWDLNLPHKNNATMAYVHDAHLR